MLKRIYKLIITKENFYRDIQLNGLDHFENSNYNHFKIDLPMDECGSFSLSVIMKDASCSVSLDHNLKIRGSNDELGSTALLHCGDRFSIYAQDGHPLYQCEMALCELRGSSENVDYNLAIKVDGEVKICSNTASGSCIRIGRSLLGDDYLQVMCKNDSLFIRDFKAKHGLFVNGTRIYQNSVIRNNSFFAIDGVCFYYKDGYIFTYNGYSVHVSSGMELISTENNGPLKYPKFNRSTRLQTIVPDDPIEILDPPPVPQKPKRNLLLTLMPSLAMLVLIIVVRGLMSNTGGSFVLFSACMMGVGILTSIFTYIDEKKNYKKSLDERILEYNAYISKKRQEITDFRSEEKGILEEIYHDIPRDIQAVQNFNSELFDRNYNDVDFLQVYLGKGDIPAYRKISYKKREQIEVGDSLSEIPEQVENEFKNVQDVPVKSDFAKSNCIGFIGEDVQLYNQMKNLTLDICTRHYFRDVRLFYIVNPDFADKIMWLRWLPHVKNDELGVRNIVCSNESKTELLEYLYVLLNERSKKDEIRPHVVVFVLNDIGIKTHPVSQFFENASNLGVTFVFFEEHKALLPEFCSEVIMLDPKSNTGNVCYRENSTISTSFKYENIDDSVAEQVSLRLAPVYCEEISLEHQLRKKLSFFEMCQIWSSSDISLFDNWMKSDATKSLAAPIGVNAKNELVYLDIHEKAHGPHGLVAGTTGSGKSELLQSYILSMAMHYHPTEVGFVLIDFKGGGMASIFSDLGLPHLIGTITNIDGDSINRSLLSIKAELNKRQKLFAEYKVTHIDQYIGKFKKGDTAIALPHLIIIVDEFAELKSQHPDFMKELDSASRIGRSLGIHLILATQKPSGQINEQIWSNSRFKLCLKVQSQNDSNEVIKSPLAAEIREPGRAYFQVGNNEIFELLQSGYSGCSSDIEHTQEKDFSIREVSLWGKQNVVYKSNIKKKKKEDQETQCSAIVNHITGYCETNKIKPLRSICLPELPEVIPYLEGLSVPADNNIVLNVGRYDDPENQHQGDILLDLTAGNTAIIGSSQYGKTNFLQTIVRGLAEKYTPKDVNIYIIDFNSMILTNFASLPHVGGVVCLNEDEKLENLLKMLYKEIEYRKAKFADLGVSSFSAYREAGYSDFPQIVVCVDNFTALREMYLINEDPFLPLCRDGIGAGISIIVTNSQTKGLTYQYLSYLPNRIALYCTDSSEYPTLLEHCRLSPKEFPGSAIIQLEKRKLYGQMYLAFNGARETERVEGMRLFVQDIRDRYPDAKASVIPLIPKLLTKSYVKDNLNIGTDNNTLLLGLDYSTVKPLTENMSELGVLLLSGRKNAGKTNCMKYIAEQYLSQKQRTKIYVIDDANRKLSYLKEKKEVCLYTLDVDQIIPLISSLESDYAERYKNFVCDEKYDSQMTLLLVSNPDIISVISGNADALSSFNKILKKYVPLGFAMIINNIDNTNRAGEPVLLKSLREQKRILYFDEISKFTFFEKPRSANQFKKNIENGDAYYLKDGNCFKIKTVKADL